jgi:glycine cleavage system H protein
VRALPLQICIGLFPTVSFNRSKTMSELPGDLRFTSEHEWLRKEEDGSVTIGITDHAQSALGDLVFVELPETGQELEAGGEMAVVESVKAASDVYAPVSGTVLEVNSALVDDPEKINADPYGEGWIVRMQPSDDDPGDTLDPDGYQELLDELES